MKSKSTVFKVLDFSDTNACLQFPHSGDQMFEPYAEAFRRAGRTLFEKNFLPETRNDLDALPMAFLYRQSVELALKAIVRMANKILDLRRQPLLTVRKTHELTMLLGDCKPAVALVGWQWDAGTDGLRSFDDFRRVLTALEKDVDVGIDDRRSDVWRYPVKSDGTPSLPSNFYFDVREYVLQVEALLDVFQGLALMLEDLYDGTCESFAEYYE